MRRSLVLLPVVALAWIWACGGATTSDIVSGDPAPANARSGTSGTTTSSSGSSGTSGTTTSSSGSSGTTTDASVPPTPPVDPPPDAGPATCKVGGNTCVKGEYCSGNACGTGTCVPRGTTQTAEYDPVCGCDNVTYWNASMAAFAGVSVASAGVCTTGALTCPQGSCPSGADGTKRSCSNVKAGIGSCALSNNTRLCWVLPDACPNKPRIRQCGVIQCRSACEGIRGGTAVYEDATCN